MFWCLTYREFNIKNEAFNRAEDRQRALVFELASMTGQFKDSDHDAINRNVISLRRYPVKRWMIDGEG